MVEYTFDSEGIKILDSAIRHIEFEMTSFENKKTLMGSQTRMDVRGTAVFVDKMCGILPKLEECVLIDNDISGVYIALNAYKKSIETTLLIKQKTENWTFNPSELESKVPQIDKELEAIEHLYGVPVFQF